MTFMLAKHGIASDWKFDNSDNVERGQFLLPLLFFRAVNRQADSKRSS